MKRGLFTLLLFVCTCAFLPAQEKNTEKVVPKSERVVKNNKKGKKTKGKSEVKDNVCHLFKDDELKSLADGKITHPMSIPRIKREIFELTSCPIENIIIISGGDSGNTVEYIACVCGTKMIYKADYPMKIRTVTEL